MTRPIVPTLVNLPNRAVPANFSAYADALWPQINSMVTQMNALGLWMITPELETAIFEKTNGWAGAYLKRNPGYGSILAFQDPNDVNRVSFNYRDDGIFSLQMLDGAGTFVGNAFWLNPDDPYIYFNSGFRVGGDVNMNGKSITNVNRLDWDTGGTSGDYMTWYTTSGLFGYENGAEIFRLCPTGKVSAIKSLTHSASFTGNAANVHVTSTGYLYKSTSSGEFKINREALEGALETVKALNPISFESTHEADEGKRFIGFIAEEVAEAVPEAEMDGGENYDMRALIALQAAAIRELSDKLDAALDRIEALEERVADLEA